MDDFIVQESKEGLFEVGVIWIDGQYGRLYVNNEEYNDLLNDESVKSCCLWNS